MPIDDANSFTTPGRFPFHLTDRFDVNVMNPVDDLAVVWLVLDGELVCTAEEQAGEA